MDHSIFEEMSMCIIKPWIQLFLPTTAWMVNILLGSRWLLNFISQVLWVMWAELLEYSCECFLTSERILHLRCCSWFLNKKYVSICYSCISLPWIFFSCSSDNMWVCCCDEMEVSDLWRVHEVKIQGILSLHSVTWILCFIWHVRRVLTSFIFVSSILVWKWLND